MRHKNCAKESEIVYYCSRCGHIKDAPEVREVLTAARGVRQTPFHKRVALIDAVMNLNDAIRSLEEMEKDNV